MQTVNITNTTRNESILQLSFLKHQLLPGDKLTFYDGNLTRVLREYTVSTETPALSFFTTLPDAKVVFTANTSDLTSTRSFIFLYRTVPKGTCTRKLHILPVMHTCKFYNGLITHSDDSGYRSARESKTIKLFSYPIYYHPYFSKF